MKKERNEGLLLKMKNFGAQMWKARYLYLLILPFLVWMIVFHYMPMGGILMAFKDYKARLGIWGSEWIGLEHFRRIFITPAAIGAIKNTFTISFNRILWEFPMPIMMAILITEMRGNKLKKSLSDHIHLSAFSFLGRHGISDHLHFFHGRAGKFGFGGVGL